MPSVSKSKHELKTDLIELRVVQKVVVGKTPGHQPASLQVHGLIASILVQMDVLDYMRSHFISRSTTILWKGRKPSRSTARRRER
ncbi:hypothetical protein [Metarhizobium album]|uniref:hypothetical protein n=1 Tax=Metarhizobium album TaxID=2182425 RepID=UPI00197CE29B|nr:hypothetical protein [Rhizobium album]